MGWTAEKPYRPQYNKLILDTDEAIRELEIRCVNEGTEIATTSTKVRYFWMKRDDLGDFVGACSGELTNYLYAEWHISGAIHGRPISEQALRAKGVEL